MAPQQKSTCLIVFIFLLSSVYSLLIWDFRLWTSIPLARHLVGFSVQEGEHYAMNLFVQSRNIEPLKEVISMTSLVILSHLQ